MLTLLSCGAPPPTWYVSGSEPFDGQTGWHEDRPLTLHLNTYPTDDAVGLARAFALFKDGERVAIEHITASGKDLYIYPESLFIEGADYVFMLTGDRSDSSNFADLAVVESGGFDRAYFHVDSAPRPTCRTWYDASAEKRSITASAGVLPCVGFSEPLVPGWVDLSRGSFRAEGYFLKTTGLIPEEDPWLLCAVVSSGTRVGTWALLLPDDAVLGEAGGGLDGDGDGVPGGDAYIQSEYLDDCPTEAPPW